MKDDGRMKEKCLFFKTLLRFELSQKLVEESGRLEASNGGTMNSMFVAKISITSSYTVHYLLSSILEKNPMLILQGFQHGFSFLSTSPSNNFFSMSLSAERKRV